MDIEPNHRRSLINAPLWLSELESVRLLRDQLGMPVDKGIEEAVVALRLLGFKTTASCAGHSSRLTTGPYIMFASASAGRTYAAAKKIDEEDKRQDMLRRCQHETLLAALPLKALVEDYTKQRRKPAPDRTLEIRPVGYCGFRLCFVHADFSITLSETQYMRVLRGRQREMGLFVRYLQNRIMEN